MLGTLRFIVIQTVSLVPVWGGVAAAMFDQLWAAPGETDVWPQIEKRVSTLVDAKINENNVKNLKRDLKRHTEAGRIAGVNCASAIKYHDNNETVDWPNVAEEFYNVWLGAYTDRENYAPEDDLTQRVLYLPMLAQLGTLALSQLYAAPQIMQKYAPTETHTIEKYQTWIEQSVNDFRDLIPPAVAEGRARARAKGEAQRKADVFNMGNVPYYLHRYPWMAENAYERELILTVFGFSDAWKFFDEKTNGRPSATDLDYTLFSDPFGSAWGREVDLESIPTLWSTELPTDLMVYAYPDDPKLGPAKGTLSGHRGRLSHHRPTPRRQ